MPQGKTKVKTKVPDLKAAKQKKNHKGVAFTRRHNAPIQARKTKFQEVQKIKQMISKVVNKSVEDEIRSRAQEGTRNYSKAQEAVAQHHKSMPQSEPTTDAFTNSKAAK